jgi:multidrug resistance efflux pump
MLSSARRAFGLLATLLMLGAAVFAGVLIWQHYLIAPWTRDGTVEAYVVNLAPEVSGRVTKLQVVDNSVVKVGDVLYEIDPVDFQIAVANAESTVASRQSDMESKARQSARRAQLTTLSTSAEEQQTYQASADMARAAYAGAIAQLNQARIDLQRTRVTSPVNGYVTNLQLRVGDYASKGTRNVSIVDTDSFWISGNFEETKLGRIRVGDPAVAELLGYAEPVVGHVDSIARGINTPNSAPGSLGLASVNPVFTWVRLAQRIPVRIHIDRVPASVHLAVGLTATVSVGPDARPGAWHGVISRIFTQGGS